MSRVLSVQVPTASSTVQNLHIWFHDMLSGGERNRVTRGLKPRAGSNSCWILEGLVNVVLCLLCINLGRFQLLIIHVFISEVRDHVARHQTRHMVWMLMTWVWAVNLPGHCIDLWLWFNSWFCNKQSRLVMQLFTLYFYSIWNDSSSTNLPVPCLKQLLCSLWWVCSEHQSFRSQCLLFRCCPVLYV